MTPPTDSRHPPNFQILEITLKILKCGIKMNCGLNKNSGIQFAEQKKNIILNVNILEIQPNVRKLNYFRSVSYTHLTLPTILRV